MELLLNVLTKQLSQRVEEHSQVDLLEAGGSVHLHCTCHQPSVLNTVGVGTECQGPSLSRPISALWQKPLQVSIWLHLIYTLMACGHYI